MTSSLLMCDVSPDVMPSGGMKHNSHQQEWLQGRRHSHESQQPSTGMASEKTSPSWNTTAINRNGFRKDVTVMEHNSHQQEWLQGRRHSHESQQPSTGMASEKTSPSWNTTAINKNGFRVDVTAMNHNSHQQEWLQKRRHRHGTQQPSTGMASEKTSPSWNTTAINKNGFREDVTVMEMTS